MKIQSSLKLVFPLVILIATFTCISSKFQFSYDIYVINGYKANDTVTLQAACSWDPIIKGKWSSSMEFGKKEHWSVRGGDLKAKPDLKLMCNVQVDAVTKLFLAFDRNFAKEEKCKISKEYSTCFYLCKNDGIYFSKTNVEYPGPEWHFVERWEPYKPPAPAGRKIQ
ncbi:hypothetical protein POM88_011426 [Heracleum sosnowskyi]|uniref:S-protein homolog n=1 Tax=Heracleum sosnowskyi TaxID=360622 RepID=A0AAD8MWH5_9APIA|nr:hypothetical protein POM88_011426 [Heracleum sosnowskyi]